MQKEYDDIINKPHDEYQLTHRQAGEVSMPCTEPSKSQKNLLKLKAKFARLAVLMLVQSRNIKRCPSVMNL